MSWINSIKDDTPEDPWGANMSLPSAPRCPTKYMRFYLPYGQSTEVIFLTAKPEVVIWEHQVTVGNDRRNYATCLRHLNQECPLCSQHPTVRAGVKTYRAALFSVIHLTQFELKKGDRAGTIIKNPKLFLVAKEAPYEILGRRAKKLAEKDLTLRGAKFTFTRSTAKTSANVGDDIQFEEMVDLDQYEDTTELNYEELFKPDPELVKAYLQSLSSFSGAAQGSERIPF